MKKLVKLMYVIVIAAMLLSACGTAATPTPTTAGPATAAPATAAPVPTAMATPEPVKLVYWSMYNQSEPQGQVEADAVDLFQKANPNVTIEIDFKGRDVKNLALPALQAGTQIDLFESDNGLMASKYGQYLLPITDAWLNQPSADVAGKSVKDTILPVLFQQAAMNSTGQMLSMPINPYLVLLFYNQKQFADAGITGNPTDMDELMVDFAALKAKGYTPMSASVDAYVNLTLGILMMRAKGCDAFQATWEDKTGKAWNDPLYLEAFQFVEQWEKSGYLPAGIDGNLWPAGQQDVALGKASMEFNGTWMPMEVADSSGPNFQWGSMTWPALRNGTGDETGTFVGAQGIGITNTSKNPEVAWNFIKFLLSKQIGLEYVKAANLSSLTEVPWTGPLTSSWPVVQSMTTGYPWDCNFDNAGDIVSVISPIWRELFVGKITAQQFIDQVSKDQAKFYTTQK